MLAPFRAIDAVTAVRAGLRRGFYAVLDRDDEQLARTLVGPGGSAILQVRLKPAAVDDIMRVARMARRVCDQAGAQLVINDRIDIALSVGADGVHLGQTDVPLKPACTLVGTRLAIGISTHNLAQVRAAVALAPAYIAYGPIFATTTKHDPDPVQGLAALRAATREAGTIPVVAIGGITPATARHVYAARAASICAINAVNAAPDVAAAAQSFRRISPWLATGDYSVVRPGRSVAPWSQRRAP